MAKSPCLCVALDVVIKLNDICLINTDKSHNILKVFTSESQFRTDDPQYLQTHIVAYINFSSDPKNMAELWRCSSCQTNIDTQCHILWCQAYAKLREGKSLDNDHDLVQYFQQVLNIRTKLKLNK